MALGNSLVLVVKPLLMNAQVIDMDFAAVIPDTVAYNATLIKEGLDVFANLFPTPQDGQTQSSGSLSKDVPGAMFWVGSPAAGSYMYPHTVQRYLSI
jgi:hypothetical protein